MSNVPSPTSTQAPDLEAPKAEIDAKVGQSLDEVIAAHDELQTEEDTGIATPRGVKTTPGQEHAHLKKSVGALDGGA